MLHWFALTFTDMATAQIQYTIDSKFRLSDMITSMLMPVITDVTGTSASKGVERVQVAVNTMIREEKSGNFTTLGVAMGFVVF